METTNLSAFLLNSTTLEIPLTWDGSAFTPGTEWALIFTAKYRSTDRDIDAVFQKASGAGITATGSTASVEMVPDDTTDVQPCTLLCDVHAQSSITDEVRTVAFVRLELSQPITRENTTSVPVVTTEDPMPFSTLNTSNSSTGGNGSDDEGKALLFDADGAVTAAWYRFPSQQSQNSKTVDPLIYPPNYASSTVSANFEAIYKLPLLSTESPNVILAQTPREDGKVSYNDLVDVPATVPLTSSKVVANAAARLALSEADAEGFAVVDSDTGKSWMLVAGGNPSVSGDWLQLGDRDIRATDISDVSATGGSSKILQTDTNGNLKLTSLRNIADTGGLIANGGNLLLTDRQMVGWYAADDGDANSPTGDGKMLFRIWHDNAHPNETHVDANGNVVLYWGTAGVQKALQLGSASGGAHWAYWSSGPSSAGTTMRQSVPFGFNTQTWTGGVDTNNMMAMQAAPLDTSGTNSAFQFFRNCSLGSSQAINGTKIAEIAPAGVWSAGTAPALDTLTDGATITQICSKYKTVQAASVTLGGNRTLAISGAEAGMRGVIYVKQDSTGGRLLTLPDGSATTSTWALSTVGNKIDRLSWEYDGTYFYWTITAGINLPLDSDAATFISAASLTDDTQKSAVNNLVLALKSNSLWTKFHAIYPFVGGNATAHSKDLKAAYNGSFAGTVTHDANGITGDGSTGYFNTGFKPTNGSQNDVMAYVYCRTQSPTTGKVLIGAEGSRYFVAKISGSSIVSDGPNSGSLNTNSVTASSDFRKHIALSRSSSTACNLRVGSSAGTFSNTSTGQDAVNFFLLAKNINGSPSAGTYSNANIAFSFFGQSLSDSEWATFKTIVDQFQTTLGRANP